jgi:hypothetical protein
MALGVFGSGELLAKTMQPEAVVDALVEDTAQNLVPFNEQHILAAVLAGGDSRRYAGRSASDDNDIAFYFSH